MQHISDSFMQNYVTLGKISLKFPCIMGTQNSTNYICEYPVPSYHHKFSNYTKCGKCVTIICYSLSHCNDRHRPVAQWFNGTSSAFNMSDKITHYLSKHVHSLASHFKQLAHWNLNPLLFKIYITIFQKTFSKKITCIMDGPPAPKKY